jgi:hypothetical protein
MKVLMQGPGRAVGFLKIFRKKFESHAQVFAPNAQVLPGFSHQMRKFFNSARKKRVKNRKNLQKFAFFSKNVQKYALFGVNYMRKLLSSLDSARDFRFASACANCSKWRIRISYLARGIF